MAGYPHDVLTRNSLKVMDVALFEARYREARPAFERRFLYARRSQSYDDRLVPTTAKKMAAIYTGGERLRRGGR